MTKDFMLFSGTSNPSLTEKIAKYLKHPLNDADVLQFSDGEIRIEINECVRGKEVFIIQSTSNPVNNNLMELLIMSDALHRSGADRIIVIAPYYGYARQDRRPDFTRTPITSRLVAKMIEVSNIDQIITIDLHSGQQQGFFDIPISNLSASPIIVADIWEKLISQNKEIVVVSPDVGGVARARRIAKDLGNADLVIIDKRREEANQSEVMNIIGDVKNKHCIIVDDMIDTAGTLCKAGDAIKKQGAISVHAYATHPVFSGLAIQNIEQSSLDSVTVMDTIPINNIQSSKINVLSVSSILSEVINRINSNQSISNIFI